MEILVIWRRTKNSSNYIQTIHVSRPQCDSYARMNWMFARGIFYSIFNNVTELMKRKKKTPFDGLRCTTPLSNTDEKWEIILCLHILFSNWKPHSLWIGLCSLHVICELEWRLENELRNKIRWRFWYLTNEGLFGTNNESLRNSFRLFLSLGIGDSKGRFWILMPFLKWQTTST